MRRILPLVMLAAVAAAPAPVFTIVGEAFAQDDILDARAIPDVDGGASVMVTFSPNGAQRLHHLTEERAGRTASIRLNGAVLSEPVIQAPIDGGVIEISGHFPMPEAEALAKRISGRDPLPDSMDQ